MLTKTLFVSFCCIVLTHLAFAACEDPPRLRFSLVPQADAKKDSEDFKPLLLELERALKRPVDVVIPSSYSAVIERLLAGSVDVAMMGPASYARAKNADSQVTAFATLIHQAGAFQDEGPTYRSLLIVRNDSRFNSLESLKGARLVLVDPESTSGAVIPRYLVSPMLRMPFENFFGRIAYSGGHDKSAKSVESHDSDAAFVASFLLADFISGGKGKKEDFRVIWQSEPIPLDPFVYRGTLCSPIKEQIKKVFLSNDGQAYPHLLRTINALRFTTINDDRYTTIREILQSPK